MNPEIKKEWLFRLRSGNIPQMTESLGNFSGERCCLGVLCDIAVDAGIIQVLNEYENSEYGDYIYGVGDDKSLVQLPEEVQLWAGIDTPCGEVRIRQEDLSGVYYEDTSLADLNDHGSTFTEIADVIEEYF